MLFIVLAGFAFGFLAPYMVKTGRAAGTVLALLPSALFIVLAGFIPQIAHGEKVIFLYDWLPALGVSLTLCVDGLSLLFSLLITGIGAIVCLYSPSYFAGRPDLGRFASILYAFMASMLGVVLADDVIALFLFWELTSVTSYLLIGFDHRREAARKAALQALLVTGLGGLGLLASFLLMHQLTGTFQISAMLDKASVLTGSPMYSFLIILFLLGIATKSAQFPFHFWLPNAMEAPTPVSTYLHAATMVKAGIYLAARLSPILGDTQLWHTSLMSLGAATMLTGAALALLQTDLKRILAQSTVSALGILMMLVGIGSSDAFLACMVFLTAHGMYKATLFLAAGIIDHETGTRDVEKLGCLYRAMPVTCAATLFAALSSAGLPPFLGFIGKELLYQSTLSSAMTGFLTASALLVSISLVVVAGLVGLKPYFGSQGELPKHPHEPPVEMWVGPLLLAALGFVFGLAPGYLEKILIGPAVWSALGRTAELHLPQWHLYDLKVLLSVTAFILGGLIFWKWSSIRRPLAALTFPAPLTPGRLYEASLEGLEAVASLQTRSLQSGRLHQYLLIVILTTVVLLAYSFRIDGIDIAGLKLWRWTDIRTYEAIIAIVIVVATAVVVCAPSRLEAVVALGVVGYGVALTFLVFSAPDLAMTQFAIETLSVILLVLVLFRLPKYRRISTNWERLRDGVAALAAGGIATLLVLLVTSVDRIPRLVAFFAENSYLLAKGRNVVNVILVDFRGFDTLGEITVLAVAAVGVLALVKFRTGDRDDGADRS